MLPNKNFDDNSERIKKMFETKRTFFEEKNKVATKIMNKGPELERRIISININFDPEKYKCI